jgi:hypothetical protein
MGISSALGSQALLPAGLGFRNVLINGDFKVWQRGTSGAMATGFGTGYLADRWTSARAGYAAGGTVSRQTASLDGFQYCSRVQRDSGNTSTVSSWYFQTLETVTSIPLVNKPVVYSFYIRAGANFSGSVIAQLYSGTATDQGSYPNTGITGSVTVIASTLSLTTSWQRVVLYGNVGATATQLFAGFQHTPSGTAGAADYYEITGVQLEQNLQPTPFEQRPIGVELALCRRYYQWVQAIGNGCLTLVYGNAYANPIPHMGGIRNYLTATVILSSGSRNRNGQVPLYPSASNFTPSYVYLTDSYVQIVFNGNSNVVYGSPDIEILNEL